MARGYSVRKEFDTFVKRDPRTGEVLDRKAWRKYDPNQQGWDGSQVYSWYKETGLDPDNLYSGEKGYNYLRDAGYELELSDRDPYFIEQYGVGYSGSAAEQAAKGRESADYINQYVAGEEARVQPMAEKWKKAYESQLDEAYKKTQENLISSFASRGLIGSSSAYSQYGDLAETYQKGLADIASGTEQTVQDYINNLDAIKTQAYMDMGGLAEMGSKADLINQLYGELQEPTYSFDVQGLFAPYTYPKLIDRYYGGGY